MMNYKFFAILSLSFLISCGKEQNIQEELFGTYTTQTVEVDEKIDILGANYPKTELYFDMKYYGYWGTHTVNREGHEGSPFGQNRISPSPIDELEVQLFLPFPNCTVDGNRKEWKQGVCDVFVDEYSILCEIEDDGTIRIIRTSDGQKFFKNPRLEYDLHSGDRVALFFEADTFYYDWKTEQFVDRHVKVTLLKNYVIRIVINE